MRRIFILYMLIGILFSNCKNQTLSEEQKEEAKVELDTILKDVVQDTLITSNPALPPAVKQAHTEHVERIEKKLEESKYKDIPCKVIMDDLKSAVDLYCKGSLTEDELVKKLPDMDDSKINLCINANFKTEYDNLQAKIEKCLELKNGE